MAAMMGGFYTLIKTGSGQKQLLITRGYVFIILLAGSNNISHRDTHGVKPTAVELIKRLK